MQESIHKNTDIVGQMYDMSFLGSKLPEVYIQLIEFLMIFDLAVYAYFLKMFGRQI